MSDVTVLPTGGTSGGGGGVNWLLVGGAGLGVLVLIMMMRGKGGAAGQPTTTAGTSINAALGSIQEQNLNIMGEISQNDQRLSGELSNVNNNVIAGTQVTVENRMYNTSYLADMYNGLLTILGQMNPQAVAASGAGDVPAGESPGSWLYKFLNEQYAGTTLALPASPIESGPFGASTQPILQP